MPSRMVVCALTVIVALIATPAWGAASPSLGVAGSDDDCSHCTQCMDPQFPEEGYVDFWPDGVGGTDVLGDLTHWGCIEYVCEDMIECPGSGGGDHLVEVSAEAIIDVLGEEAGLTLSEAPISSIALTPDHGAVLFQGGCGNSVVALIVLTEVRADVVRQITEITSGPAVQN